MQNLSSSSNLPADGAAPSSRFIQVSPRLPRVNWREQRWSGLWSSVPALLLLGLAVGASAVTLPQPILLETPPISAIASVSELPASETMLVLPQATAGQITWRGRLQPAVSVVGRAPISGEVAFVWTKPGRKIEVGDPVLQLSSGAESRGPTRAESQQNEAEKAQVAAANQQMALQGRIGDAQARLHESQLRVAAAQRRVAQARELLEQVKRETLQPERRAAANNAPQAAASPAPQAGSAARGENPARRQARASRDAAARETAAAERAIQQAATRTAASRRAVDAAQKEVDARTQALTEARQRYLDVQKKFDAGEAKGSEVELARGAIEDAQAAVKAATGELETARDAAEKARQSLPELRTDAEQARKKFDQSLQNLKVFNDAEPAPAPRTAASPAPRAAESPATRSPNAGAPDKPRRSLAEAARVVRAAVAESDAAAARVRKIKQEIEGYQSKVQRANRGVAASTQELQAAQQKVIDNTIAAKLSVVRAPATGTVLNVALIASNVTPGDAVVSIGQASTMQVNFADTSGLWRRLKKDDRLPVTIQAAPETKAASVEAGAAQPAAPQPDAEPRATSSISASARVEEIVPPATAGGAAIIKVMVYNPPSSDTERSRPFKPGMIVQCAAPAAPGQSTFMVPDSALIAAPVADAVNASATTEPSAAMIAVLEPVALMDDPNAAGDMHRIEWRRVTLGREVMGQRQVLDGLQPGERIALRPETLQRYSAKHGDRATIRIETA